MDAYLVTADATGTSQRDGTAEPFELTAEHLTAAFGVPVARPLGRGTFGETWRLDAADGTSRAAKVLVNQRTSHQRLAREVESLRRVVCPNVVQLLDTVVTAIGGVDRAALIFEFIDGGDVARRLRAAEPVSPDDVIDFGHGLFAGLGELHAQDVVHRDIKPANVALRNGAWNEPVVLDLGLARMLDLDSITRYPAWMGTALFMAPEQLRQERARKAADVFAAGVILHLMLTGGHPFYDVGREIHVDEAVELIGQGPKPLPDTVPAQLAAVVKRLLSAEEGDRGSAQRACREFRLLRQELGK